MDYNIPTLEKSKVIIKNFIFNYIYTPTYFQVVYFRDLRKIKKQYGDFERLSKLDFKKYTLVFNDTAKNVSGVLIGEIVKTLSDLELQPKRVLLDGENKLVVNQFKERFNFDSAEVLTVGVGSDFDYDWNFENEPPKNLPNDFDLIISQAMLEHLVDPYKHLTDLTNRLKSGGVIIVHSVMSGYPYHRFPVDTIRFFPDWFETSAERLKLQIIRKFRRDFHLVYLFKKV